MGLPGFEPESMTPEATRITKLPHSPLALRLSENANPVIYLLVRQFGLTELAALLPPYTKIGLVQLIRMHFIRCPMTLQPDSHLKVGMRAPDFSLPGSPPGDFRLSQEVKKGPVVVHFYVSDFGVMCNIVMKAFMEHKDEFDDLGVQFVGISVDDPPLHGAWKGKMNIPFKLLSDEGGKVAKEYGVLMEDELYFKLANRAVFLVDKDLVIRFLWVAHDPAYGPNYEEVMEAVRALVKGHP